MNKYIIETLNLENINQRGYVRDQDVEHPTGKIKIFSDEKEAQRWMVANSKLLRPGWGHTVTPIFIIESENEGE